MTLLPGLERELLGAALRTDPSATQRAPCDARRSRASHRRRGPHLGLWAVLGLLAFGGGGAYAARGLWTPILGSEDGGRPKATMAAPPADQLRHLAILRRPQTEADRAAASAVALTRLLPTDGRVRTPYVRRLATLPNGAVVVLAPVGQRRSEGFGDRKQPAQLCLIVVPTRGEAEPPSCGDSGVLLSGGMWLDVKDPLTRAQERAQKRVFDRAAAQGLLPTAERPQQPSQRIIDRIAEDADRAVAASGPRQRSYVVQLVPDVVRRAERFDLPGKPTYPVSGNVFTQQASPAAWVTWLDEDGRRLNADGTRVEPSALVPPVGTP